MQDKTNALQKLNKIFMIKSNLLWRSISSKLRKIGTSRWKNKRR